MKWRITKIKDTINLDQAISIQVLKQFAEKKNINLDLNRKKDILYLHDLYVDYVNKNELN